VARQLQHGTRTDIAVQGRHHIQGINKAIVYLTDKVEAVPTDSVEVAEYEPSGGGFVDQETFRRFHTLHATDVHGGAD